MTKIASTLFVKKSEQSYRHGAPIPDTLYNIKYILKFGKYCSPKELNDMFVLHRMFGTDWEILIKENIK
jgi:hypothetical protein